MRLSFLIAFLTCCSISNGLPAQDATNSPLAQQTEILELKLRLAEEQLKQLQEECDSLRRENAKLKNEETDPVGSSDDPFAVGVVWVGTSQAAGAKQSVRWAISISKRDGEQFEGGVAAELPNGDKLEFPVTGRAPQRGNGLVIIESPMIGRAKIFMRGTLRNGAIALAFSGTGALGKKVFGSATLSPKN